MAYLPKSMTCQVENKGKKDRKTGNPLDPE